MPEFKYTTFSLLIKSKLLVFFDVLKNRVAFIFKISLLLHADHIT